MTFPAAKKKGRLSLQLSSVPGPVCRKCWGAQTQCEELFLGQGIVPTTGIGFTQSCPFPFSSKGHKGASAVWFGEVTLKACVWRARSSAYSPVQRWVELWGGEGHQGCATQGALGCQSLWSLLPIYPHKGISFLFYKFHHGVHLLWAHPPTEQGL